MAPAKPKMKGRVPLYRALSKLGFASRAQAESLISEGRVKVHGSVETNPQRMVNPDTAFIEVAGQEVLRSVSRVIRYYKPKGVITTRRDPEGRPTIFDHLPPELQTFHAVGRLDQHTTGLLLLTNDTRISHFLTNPENQISRTYVVRVQGACDEAVFKSMQSGVEDQGELLKAASAQAIKVSGKESLIELTLLEGKNREIRRLCMALGHEVISLKRISFGSYELGNLEPGQHQEAEVASWIKVSKIEV